ncbi:hypothetical protein D3C87_1268770 [compost metagenome]
MAVAVASLRMEKLSMTSGASAFKSPDETATPSRMISGLVAPLNVEIPRMKNEEPSAPGWPER